MNGNGFYSKIRYVSSPCLDCPDRRVGCQAICNKYDEYRVTLEAEKAKLKEYYKAQKLVEDFEIEMKLKHRKRMASARGEKF